MDKKEMLYEISLKYNTLKMYDNTIEQMKKNNNTGDSLNSIIKERDVIEKELVSLFDPKLATPINSCAKDPSISEEKLNGNKFIQATKKRCEYKKLYDIRKNFFDDIEKPTPVGFMSENELKKIVERKEYNKKPTYADVQEKISNSQWISRSNFIVRFNKEKINIDEWRVSSFYYQDNGNLSVTMNDFAEKNEDGTYNILSKIALKLQKDRYAGDIIVDIITNSGELLYKMVFANCEFKYADSDGFTYESAELRKTILNFHFEKLHILAPNEKLNETTN